jgi:hypothetical protein
MPTQLSSLENTQGAVTVFFDEQAEENIIEAQMREVFADPRQYMYLKKVPETGKEFVQRLKKERQAGDLAVPKGERIVFCHYLELRSLTEGWIKDFFERAYDFRKSMGVNTTTFQHHYVFCFRYEVNTLEEDEKEKAKELLKKIAEGNELISRQIYLLRIQGLDTYDNQEKGLVQMLHLLSRSSYAVTLKGINAYKTYINMISKMTAIILMIVSIRHTLNRDFARAGSFSATPRQEKTSVTTQSGSGKRIPTIVNADMTEVTIEIPRKASKL